MAKGYLSFKLRTDKINGKGQSPIELMYSLKGKRKYCGIGERLYSLNWDATRQEAIFAKDAAIKKAIPEADIKLIPTKNSIQSTNARLREIAAKVEAIEQNLMALEIPLTSEEVINRVRQYVTGKVPEATRTDSVFSFIEGYIKSRERLLVPGSLTVYKSLAKHLKNFEKQQRVTLTFQSMTAPLFVKFFEYLVSPKVEVVVNGEKKDLGEGGGLINVTARKQISTLKTFLGYAKSAGIAIPDGYKDYKMKSEDLEVVALTEAEFEQLVNFDLKGNKRLERVRDIFLFSCVTGLRYSDLKLLKWENIGDEFISISVRKTGQLLKIPLTSYSIEILEKYKENAKPLPVIANQVLNRFIKELFKLAGINTPVEVVRLIGNVRRSTIYPKYELISIHTGRKSMATLSLAKGMPMTDVMACGGWVSWNSFKRYVKVADEQKAKAMHNVWGSPAKESKLKAV